ncbi:MAG: I78 family peptidase inhibitor [Sphingobium sp.]
MDRLLIIGAIALLAGCSTMTAGPPASPSTTADACNAAAVQDRVGQTATAQLGADLLKATGARTLRWLAPGMAATMDFRPDRLSVSYDENLAIVRIACG